MIAIYDFDGTLTPYSLAQYDILKQQSNLFLDISKSLFRQHRKIKRKEKYHEKTKDVFVMWYAGFVLYVWLLRHLLLPIIGT